MVHYFEGVSVHAATLLTHSGRTPTRVCSFYLPKDFERHSLNETILSLRVVCPVCICRPLRIMKVVVEEGAKRVASKLLLVDMEGAFRNLRHKKLG